MKVLMASVLVSVASSIALADTYTWKDEDGRVHYSDKPIHEDATRLDDGAADKAPEATLEALPERAAEPREQPRFPCESPVAMDGAKAKGDRDARHRCLDDVE